MNALLVAESEHETRSFLERQLSRDGFEVIEARAARDVLDLAERARPDLVLVGSSLVDALDVCTRIRSGEPGRSWDRDVPLIVLGDDEADALDRVRAFARGCDDFVGRPLVYEELLARIRAVLRRAGAPEHERLDAGEIVIDRRTRHVAVAGLAVRLAGKEFELLAKLATDPTRVFTKEQLLRDVWGFRSLGRTRTLDSHASRLRRKLAEASNRPYVLNVWGVGYRLMQP